MKKGAKAGISNTDFAFESVPRVQRLSDKVAGMLIDAVKSGQFPPGSRLPSERELGAQFDVSRTVIREAVRSLTALQLVTATAGRGVEVCAPPKRKAAPEVRLTVKGYGEIDYSKVHEVRVPIELQTASLAAQRADAAGIENLRAILDKHQQLLQKGKLAAAGKVDLAFHDRIAEIAGNPLLLAMYHSLGELLKQVRTPAVHSLEVAEGGLRSHRWLLECIAVGDADAAKGAMERHLAEAERIWRGEIPDA
jgi:GntR family transcriptional repressor for pyruvate dehydrogenase complex